MPVKHSINSPPLRTTSIKDSTLESLETTDIPTTVPLSVEEQFERYYKGKPGIVRLTSDIFTDKDTGKRYRRVYVSPNGSCYFYSLVITREDVVQTLCDATDQLHQYFYTPHMEEYAEVFRNLSWLQRSVLNDIKVASTHEEFSTLSRKIDTHVSSNNAASCFYDIPDTFSKKSLLISALKTLKSDLDLYNKPETPTAIIRSKIDGHTSIIEDLINSFLDTIIDVNIVQGYREYSSAVSSLLSTFTLQHPSDPLSRKLSTDIWKGFLALS